MIAVLISFDAIQIAYSDTIDETQHIVCEEVSPGVHAFIKEGVKLRQLFECMADVKNCKMDVQSEDRIRQSVIFVCFSAKSKSVAQKVFQRISPQFQKVLHYFNIDKTVYGQFPFNRPLIKGNQICFGEGFSQLRQKEELRISLASAFRTEDLIQYIFVQKNANEIKELKKEGFTGIMDTFEVLKFKTLYQNSKTIIGNVRSAEKQQQKQKIIENQYPNAKQYIKSLLKTHKEIGVKSVVGFDKRNLTIFKLISQLYAPSAYYNISAKSWTKMPKSRQISSYIFHNLSDNQLYIAKAARPKDLSNEQDFQIKVLANKLNFLVDPEAYAVPHDKNISLIKFSKLKCYQNKKAFLNIRPYIEGLKTVDEIGLRSQQCLQLFLRGTLNGKKVKGVGGLILYSWLINQNLNIKPLCMQVALIGVNGMDGEIRFVDQKSIGQENGEIGIVRTDYFSVFNMNNFKVIQDFFLLSRSQQIIQITIHQLSQSIVKQMCDLLNLVDQQVVCMMRGLFLYYRWNTKMVNYYQLLQFRIKSIRQLLCPLTISLNSRKSLLVTHPELACLMLPQKYDCFMLPIKNTYFPGQTSYEEMMASEKAVQNPYLVYVNKGCSFGIFNLNFPVLTFLQWMKSSSRFHAIEYISMISRSLQDYIVMDKRLKLMSVNDKKNVILVVDHAELFSQLISKPKSVKTVLIYRLKKPAEVQDFGMIGSDVEKKEWFQDSQEELIQVLLRERRNLFGDISKFELYDWVLSSFMRIKCRMYNLPYAQSQLFLSTLHKAICTNRHRIKELQQNYKQKCQLLYVIPILKQNQKIHLNYHLFQFLHVKQLFTDILEGRWNCRLQTYQNGAVNCLRHIIDTNLATRVTKQLIRKLQSLSFRQMSSLQYKNASSDCLEIIRTLTQTAEANLIEQEPFRYYYQVFVEFVSIKNYSSIECVCFSGKYLLVAEEQRLFIESQKDSLSCVLDNLKVVALNGCQNMVSYVAYHIQTKSITIKQFQIIENPNIQQKQCLEWSISNKHFSQIYFSAEFRMMQFKRFGEQLVVVFVEREKLIVCLMSVFDGEKGEIKQYTFSRPIIFLKFIFSNNQSTSILLATQEQVSIIQIDKMQLPLSACELFRVNFGITKVLVEEEGNSLRLFLYKLHIVQQYVIINNQVISKSRYQLAKNAKTLAYARGKLYIFYENDDMIDILAIRNQSLVKIWSYYWVESNCQALYIKENYLFLRGASYTKLVHVRNGERLDALMV